MRPGTGPTPLPGMSVPRDAARRGKRRRTATWVTMVLGLGANLALSSASGLLWGDDGRPDDADHATAARVLLSRADLGDGWDEDRSEDDYLITVGLTEHEADCLGVEPPPPPAERASSSFTKGDVTVSAQVAVWPDEGVAMAAAEAMARPEFPSCFTGQLQLEEWGDPQDRADVTLLGSGPASADPTIRRSSHLYGWSDGSMETYDTYQAFKGRIQVVLFAFTPAGVDQAFAVELVRRMLARVG